MQPSKVIQQTYNAEHVKRMESYAQRVQAIYVRALKEAARLASTVKKVDHKKPFSFDDFPATKAKAEKLFSEIESSVLSAINDGTRAEWLYANSKNDALVDLVATTSKLTAPQIASYKEPNLKALSAFQTRKLGSDGMGLSDKVWKYASQFRNEIEMGLDVGLGEGKGAAALSRDLMQYLQEPNKLFRRVRDKRGNLHLSKNAKAYHPGQGVYRSSYKNAMRLTRSEINNAYHESDHTRWQQLDFVVGIEVKLSNNKLRVADICDHLKGKYPKDFKFRGWHTQCMCHAVSILATEEELLNSLNNNTELSSTQAITNVPQGFTDWVEANKDRAKNWKSMPYFIKDNFKEGDLDKGLNVFTKIQKDLHIYYRVEPIKDKNPLELNMHKFKENVDSANSASELKKLLTSRMNELGYPDFSVTFSDIELDKAKLYSKELTDLANDYKIENRFFNFNTKQNKGSYGSVAATDENGKILKYGIARGKRLNVGSNVDKARLNEFATFKSRCDESKLDVSTLNHEFAHMLYVGYDKTENAVQFAESLKKIRLDYVSELRKLGANNIEFRNIYLGRYADSHTCEFMAEAFQEYRNRKTPSKYAKLVGELINKHYLK